MTQYYENDILITVCNYKKPRKSERTWPNIKGSLFSIGAKAHTLSNIGLTKRKHG